MWAGVVFSHTLYIHVESAFRYVQAFLAMLLVVAWFEQRLSWYCLGICAELKLVVRLEFICK